MSGGALLRWQHSRKGSITGRIVGGDDTWVRIKLDGDHSLSYGSALNRGRIDEHDDVPIVRRSLLSEPEQVVTRDV